MQSDGPSPPATRRRAWYLAAAAFACVTVMMLVPLGGAGGPSTWPHADKVVHFAAWMALALALWPALRGWIHNARWRRAGGFVVALGLWGVAVELLQGLVPSRSPDAWDALADALGALTGAACMAGYDWLTTRNPDTPTEELTP